MNTKTSSTSAAGSPTAPTRPQRAPDVLLDPNLTPEEMTKAVERMNQLARDMDKKGSP
jgi:hypothetical protein